MNEEELTRINVFERENDVLFSKIFKDLLFLHSLSSAKNQKKGGTPYIYPKIEDFFFSQKENDIFPLYFILGEYSFYLRKYFFMRIHSFEEEDATLLKDEFDFDFLIAMKEIHSHVEKLLCRNFSPVNLSRLYYSYGKAEFEHFFRSEENYHEVRKFLDIEEEVIPLGWERYNENNLLNTLLLLVIEFEKFIFIDFDLLLRENFFSTTSILNYNLLNRDGALKKVLLRSPENILSNTIKKLKLINFSKVKFFDSLLFSLIIKSTNFSFPSSTKSEEEEIPPALLSFFNEFLKFIWERNEISNVKTHFRKELSKIVPNFLEMIDRCSTFSGMYSSFAEKLYHLFPVDCFPPETIKIYSEKFPCFGYFFVNVISFRFKNIAKTRDLIKKYFPHFIIERGNIYINSFDATEMFQKKVFPKELIFCDDSSFIEKMKEVELSSVRKAVNTLSDYESDFKKEMKIFFGEKTLSRESWREFTSLPLLLMREVIYLQSFNEYNKKYSYRISTINNHLLVQSQK